MESKFDDTVYSKHPMYNKLKHIKTKKAYYSSYFSSYFLNYVHVIQFIIN